MPLDGVAANCLSKELRNNLVGLRVDRIYQPGKQDVSIYFRGPGSRAKLFISAKPSAPTMYLATTSPDNPQQAPNFCMMLRKYLLGAVVERIDQVAYERVFKFVFSAKNDLGDQVEKTLVAELIGKYSNIILLNDQGIIHDAIIHVDSEINRVREIMPARLYQAPPDQGKTSPGQIAGQAITEAGLAQFAEPDLARKRIESAILSLVDGFSPRLAKEVCWRAGISGNDYLGRLSQEELQTLAKHLQAICQKVDAEEFTPAIYHKGAGGKDLVDFYVLDLDHLGYREVTPSLSEAIEIFYRKKDAADSFRNKQQALLRQIRQEYKKALRKQALHQQDLSDSYKADDYRKSGELLTGQLHLVKPGMTEVKVVDYYDPDQALVAVKLDPKLSASANVEKLFKQYKKAKVRRQTASRFLAEDYARLQWLDSLSAAVRKADYDLDLSAVKQEFNLSDTDDKRGPGKGHEETAAHLLKNRLNPGKPGKKKYRPKQQKKAKKQDMPLPVRSYRTRSGVVLLCGRNNLQNDRLTLRQARKDYWWFHLKDLPGSHVIACSDQLTDDLILDAARLAAWYSSAQQSGKQSVDYCQVRHVRKPKGARPGMVIYDHYRTVVVEPQHPETFLEETD